MTNSASPTEGVGTPPRSDPPPDSDAVGGCVPCRTCGGSQTRGWHLHDRTPDIAQSVANESFRHSWDMSDERQIDGAWVQGLCCDCGEFVPYGEEIAHVAAALAPLIRKAQAAAWDDALGSCNDYSGDSPNPFIEQHYRSVTEVRDV